MKRDKFEIIAKTFQGVEEQLAEEIKALGGEDVTIGRRMVSFKGDKEMLYRANFFCRTALRILKPIYTFEAKDTDELYEKVKSLNWSEVLTPKSTFSIDAVVYSEDFKHSKFATYRAKDAIADYFAEKGGERPSVRLINTDVILNLHIAHHTCTISLDSSGESLHKRGYRVAQTEAPINEVLAAAMLLKAGWDGGKNLIDPMCGSGTILIEAALIATNTPPGIYRNGYAFERWSDFEPELLENIFNDDHAEREFEYKIYGSDISAQAIEIARQNIKSARLEKYIELEVKPIQKYTEAPENAIMVTNPPYGERLHPRDLMDIYLAFGSQLKHVFTGYDAWVISSSKEGFENIGLKPSKKIPLMNGTIECEFRKYEIFDGKYNDHKKDIAENRGRRPERGGNGRGFRSSSPGGRRDDRAERGSGPRRFDDRKPARAEGEAADRPWTERPPRQKFEGADRRTGDRDARPRRFDDRRPARAEGEGTSRPWTERPPRQKFEGADRRTGDRDAKPRRFDDRKPFAPKGDATNERPQRAPRPPRTDFDGEESYKGKVHGEEFMSKFVTFRQPTLMGGESGNKQFRKRKKKEE